MNYKKITSCICAILIMMSLSSDASVFHVHLISSQSCLADTSKTKFYEIDFDVMAGKILNAHGATIIMSDAYLTEHEFIMMKKVLFRSVARFNKATRKYPGMEIDLKKYSVQYLTYLDENGRKIIWLNGFCEDISLLFTPELIRNYNREIVSPFDGGSCYFNTRIFSKSKKIVTIYIHGSA